MEYYPLDCGLLNLSGGSRGVLEIGNERVGSFGGNWNYEKTYFLVVGREKEKICFAAFGWLKFLALSINK